MGLRLLLHVPQSDRFMPALKMAKNFLNACTSEEKPLVKIIVNFEGITVLKDFSPYSELFNELLGLGGEVYFCENALKGFNLSLDMVPKGGKTVPAGIKALVELQKEGYAYVRA
ncbi:hypothetical protein F1847_03375 [Thermodesulfobacterium sp. TA1]|uniref:DsrE family protein n=1 Tax=Thermodesulfobacterium sp. TA1 TaxID=2234087 RepID=UPI001232E2C5|nr:DsrE family protein [Thermodesulfobacterium sp. TA1]QER41833.1 hypothetical protein F1847_03375 [Thermodesulfobacterium sp. TA1]